MDLATKIQKWCDEVYYDNIFEDSKLKKCKAIAAALLSGAVDGAVIVYPVTVIAGIIGFGKTRKLRKSE